MPLVMFINKNEWPSVVKRKPRESLLVKAQVMERKIVKIAMKIVKTTLIYFFYRTATGH